MAEYRQIEQDLKIEQHRLLRMLDLAQEVILVIDGDQTIQFSNRRAEQLFALSHDQILGKTFQQWLAPDSKNQLDRMIQKLPQSHSSQDQLELTLQGNDETNQMLHGKILFETQIAYLGENSDFVLMLRRNEQQVDLRPKDVSPQLAEQDEDQLLVYNKQSVQTSLSGKFEQITNLLAYGGQEVLNELQSTNSLIAHISDHLKGDKQLLKILRKVSPDIEKVCYVVAEDHYCRFVFDTSGCGKEPTLERISVRNLNTYFNDDILIRVHRSYLVNPQRILKIRKKTRFDYEVVLNGDSLSEQDRSLPVGRSYVSILNKKNSLWFQT